MINLKCILSMIKNNDIVSARKEIKNLYKDNYKLYNYYMGLSFCREEKYNEALNYFKESIESGLSNYLLYYNLSVCYLKKGYDEVAVEYLKDSIRKNKNFEKSYINLSSVYLKHGDLKKSYRTIESGLCYCTTEKMKVMEKYIFQMITSN